MAVLTGTAGNDVLTGTKDGDAINGLAGKDKMAGGDGNDIYYVDNVGDVATELKNKGLYDTIVSTVSFTLPSNVEILELSGGALNGTGNALANGISGNDGNNKIDGGAGDDELDGGNGNDAVFGGLGGDYAAGGAGNDTVSGDAGSDYLDGNTGDDTLTGGTGNDTLVGGVGNDLMKGGNGNDDYYVDSAGDQVIEAAGQGIDRIFSSITFDLSLNGANVENLALSGDDNINGTGNSLNNIIGGNTKDNVLDGGAGNDNIGGGSGKDTLLGGSGDDILNGDSGDDSLVGGKGNDVYILGLGTDSVTELTGDGIDEVRADTDIDLNDVGYYTVSGKLLAFHVADIEKATLTYGDGSLFGNVLNNVLQGSAGNNQLSGRQGNDTMIGGAGNDTYTVDDADDKVIEQANGGIDTVQTGLSSYVLAANVENIVFDSVTAVAGIGNALGNKIEGGSGYDKLDGGDGNDWLDGYIGDDSLTGGNGSDTLDGGSGEDTMAGGKGDDVYYVDSFDDKVTEFAKEGFDAIYSLIDIDLVTNGLANIESLALLGTGNLDAGGDDGANLIYGNDGYNNLHGRGGNDWIIGAGHNDILKGGSGDDYLDGGDDNDRLEGEDGNDTLEGGAGANVLIGGKGNDVYVVTSSFDLIEEANNEGIDELRTKLSVNLTALLNVENVTLLDTSDATVDGNAQANVIIGNSGHNKLSGGDANDVLFGGLGNDTLDGGTGNDKMAGGKGDDQYYVDSAKDVVTENNNEGTDAVISAFSYTLGKNIENLTFNAATDVNGVGNALDNRIEGNDLKNKLDGGAGRDTLFGNDGNDTLLGGAGHDSLYGGAADDELRGGLGNDYLSASDGDDLLIGDAGSDYLNGGAGNDDMRGGQGNDEYRVDDINDKVTELAGQGVDTIVTSRSFDLSLEGVNVENLKAYNPKNYTLIGNKLNNTITAADAGDDVIDGQAGNDSLLGGDGNDSIVGGAGNDQLIGGKGNDTLEGGAGNDRYVEVVEGDDTLTELKGGGIDTVTALGSYILEDNFENLVLLSGGTTGDGNGLANVITASDGGNGLDGHDGNDTLIGGAGYDALVGGTGKDNMIGGGGNDIYYVDDAGDKVTEKAGGGERDIVVTTLAKYVLGANIEDLRFDVIATDVVGTGNALANYIDGANGNDKLDGKAGHDVLRGWGGNDQLIGDAGNDILLGDTGNDTLTGGAGTDQLDGGTGDDVMNGGLGGDYYLVDSIDDVIEEAVNGGYDFVSTTVSITLAANVEAVELQTSGLTVNGNDLHNAIYGSNGADTANGGKGNDFLYGGGGADILNGGDGADEIEGGFGVDTLDGGAGNDRFLYDLADPSYLPMLGGDLIVGFEVGKDKIDLRDLFEDFGIASGDVVGQGYLYLQVFNGNTNVLFDGDGGGDTFVTLATLQGVTNASLGDILYPQAEL